MLNIFELTEKTGRKIHLSQERWEHILLHKEMSNYLEKIKEALKNPLKITDVSYDETIRYYYSYLKHRKSNAKYLLVTVKYLNGSGFVITSYFVNSIK